MSTKDFHNKPFDEGTLAKLEIFEAYLKEWLPVFIQGGYKIIYIADFFAGPGYDAVGESGSPIRIIKIIELYLSLIKARGTKIKVILNDIDANKISDLRKNVDVLFETNGELRDFTEIEYSNKEFENVFNELYPKIEKYPSLIFADQNGIKFFSEYYIKAFEKIDKTDFLYFISSSYMWRFGNKNDFKKYMNIDMNKIKKNPYKFIHRSLIEQTKIHLSIDSKLKLFPFSIKKGSKIYGIVFGAKHLLAVEKFLGVVWKKNPINGEANFDIDNNETKKQLNFFEKKLTKIEKFEISLIDLIYERKSVTNQDIYLFTLENGHPPKHANEILGKLKQSKQVSYTGRPRINYDSIYNQNVILRFHWNKDEKD